MNLGSPSNAGRSITAALLFLLIGAAPVGALRIEAESFALTHNIAPDPITVSAGVLYGLDFENEWARYSVQPVLPGAYAVQLKCWGLLNYPYHMQVVLESAPGSTQTVDLQFTGRGTCGG